MSPKRERSYGPAIVLGGVLGAFLVAAALYSIRIWGELGDTSMSPSGYVALAIGVVAATGLGAGLMGLVFYSNRRGIDDDVGGAR
jgi:hypothetical protein